MRAPAADLPLPYHQRMREQEVCLQETPSPAYLYQYRRPVRRVDGLKLPGQQLGCDKDRGTCQCRDQPTPAPPTTLITSTKTQESSTMPQLLPCAASTQAVDMLYDYKIVTGDGFFTGGMWAMYSVDIPAGFKVCDATAVGYSIDNGVSLSSVPWPPDVAAKQPIFGRNNCRYTGNGDGVKTFGQISCDDIPTFRVR